MNLKIFITSNVEKKYEFTWVCNKDILVEDFLKEIKDKFFADFNIDDLPNTLLGHFNFINDGVRQKARLNFKLLSFLNNFNYELDSIHMEFLYGIGGGFDLDGIARIYVYAGERHSPHVHVFPINNKSICARINLNTMTQMKNDSVRFAEIFKYKYRKVIIRYLEENKDTFKEIYECSNKGEYITKQFILTSDGKEHTIYTI